MTTPRLALIGVVVLAAIFGIVRTLGAPDNDVAFKPSTERGATDERHSSDARRELIARLDAALDHYNRAGQAMADDPPPDVELPPIGDGASLYLAALRAHLSGEPDPAYRKTWEQWKTTLRVESIDDVARLAAEYASHDEYFTDQPTHVEARELLREGFNV